MRRICVQVWTGDPKPTVGITINYLHLLYILCGRSFKEVEQYFLNALIPFLLDEHSKPGNTGEIKLIVSRRWSPCLRPRRGTIREEGW